MGKTKRFCEIIVESFNNIYQDISFFLQYDLVMFSILVAQ